jgi:hypothetical protein
LAIEQLEKDPQDLIDFVTTTRTGKKAKHVTPVEVDPRKTNEYPLGTHPTWQEITNVFRTHPATLVSTRCGNNFWHEPFTPLQAIVVELIVKFSRQYWFTLDPHFLKRDEYPQPKDWNDVMHVWSVGGIQDVVLKPVFLPHKSHWPGLPRGPQQTPFRKRADIFFPPLDTAFAPNSIWHRLCQRGYIKDYHAYLSGDDYTEEEKTILREGLRQAFDLLDCLPNRDVNAKSGPWHFDSEKKGPTFLVNAKTYLIRGVGAKSAQRSDTHVKLTAAGLTVDALLVADAEDIPVEDARKQVLKERRYLVRSDKQRKAAAHKKRLNARSGAFKNKRKPPPPRARKKAVEEPEETEEDEEDESESDKEKSYDVDDFASTESSDDTDTE